MSKPAAHRVSWKALSIGGSCLLLAMSSAASAQHAPVNAAGFPTVSLAEAGLSPMAEHADSDTQTSPACARVVRREGRTISTAGGSREARCRAVNTGSSASAPAG